MTVNTNRIETEVMKVRWANREHYGFVTPTYSPLFLPFEVARLLSPLQWSRTSCAPVLDVYGMLLFACSSHRQRLFIWLRHKVRGWGVGGKMSRRIDVLLILYVAVLVLEWKMSYCCCQTCQDHTREQGTSYCWSQYFLIFLSPCHPVLFHSKPLLTWVVLKLKYKAVNKWRLVLLQDSVGVIQRVMALPPGVEPSCIY